MTICKINSKIIVHNKKLANLHSLNNLIIFFQLIYIRVVVETFPKIESVKNPKISEYFTDWKTYFP